MCSSLPLALVARLTRLGAALVDQARQHQGAALPDLEAAVRAPLHAALPDLLGAVVHLATPDLDSAIATVHRRCPACGVVAPMHGQRPRTVQTTRGSLWLARPWYHCPACRHGFSPVDTTLGLAPRARIATALAAWLVRRGGSTTQREAAALLTELTGLAVGMDTIREHTTAVGTAVAEADTRAIQQVQQTGQSAAPVAPAPGRLVVQADGAMVRYDDGWHEVKIGVVGGVVDGTVTAASSVAARESAEVFGPRLVAETARRGARKVVRWEGPLTRPGLAVLPPVHVVGDGAHGIGILAEDHFGARTEAVDCYHAAAHVWAVARAVCGQGTAEATAWAQARIEELTKQGGRPVHAAVFALSASTDAATAAQPARRRPLAWAITDAIVLAKRHLRHIPRNPELLVFATIQPVMFVVLFRYVFGGAINVGETTYVNYLMPGIFVQTVTFGSMMPGMGLAQDMTRGLIDRFRSLPMARSAVLTGRTLSDLVLNTFVVFVMLAVGFLVGFRPEGGPAGMIGGFALLLLVSFTFSWIAATVGLMAKSVEAVNSAGFIWLFPLTFCSSAFVRTDTMPGWLQVFADNQPLTITVNAVRGLFLEGAARAAGWQAVAWCVAILVVFVPLSVSMYRRRTFGRKDPHPFAPLTGPPPFRRERASLLPGIGGRSTGSVVSEVLTSSAMGRTSLQRRLEPPRRHP